MKQFAYQNYLHTKKNLPIFRARGLENILALLVRKSFGMQKLWSGGQGCATSKTLENVGWPSGRVAVSLGGQVARWLSGPVVGCVARWLCAQVAGWPDSRVAGWLGGRRVAM